MIPTFACPRRLARVLGVLLLAAFAPAPARAWQYPLLPHVNGLAFFPETPNTQSHVFAQLSAYYLHECWEVVDTVITDSAHVGVTIRRNVSCADSLTGWTRMFNLGQLAAGMHDLTVHCTVQVPGEPDGEEEITVPFEVANWSGPPPPPPGQQESLPLVEIIAAPAALPGAPVTITLSGFTPFECTLIHDLNNTQESIFATFDPLPSCPDTSRRWTRSFDMGSYPEGDYPVAIQLRVNVPDSNYTYGATAVVHVHEGVPPPPPIDSSSAGMSSSRPNPFRDQNSFSVSLDEAQAVDVAVFDVLGRRVTTIHHGTLPQGTSRLAWNGRRPDGSRAPGGIYFYQLTLRDRVIHRQVVLLGTP